MTSQSFLGSPHPDAPVARHALTPSFAIPSIRGFIATGGPFSQTTILAINAAAKTHLSDRIFIAYENTVNIGGDLSWRANNPGNLRGAPSKIGTVPGLAGSFAVFATSEDGFAAQRALYLNTYGTQTVRAAINHLTPPITPAIVDQDWETGATHMQAPATLTLYGCDGKPLDHLTLAAPLARLDTTPLRDPYAVIFLTTANHSAGAGCYNGPFTLLVLVLHGRLSPVSATDETGKSAPIHLAATLKSFWQTTPNGPVDDILMVNRTPDWGNDPANWNGKDFRVFYRRFHATPTGWQVRTRSAPGCWEADDDFPGIKEFPGK